LFPCNLQCAPGRIAFAPRCRYGTGAALLRPTSRLAPRCRYGRSAARPPPRAGTGAARCAPTSRLAPRCRYGRSAAAPLHRASRLAAGTGARAAAPLHRASRLAAGTGARCCALHRPRRRYALLRPYIAPRASLPVRAQRCCAPTSRLAPRCRYGRSAAAPLHRASRLAAGTGAALLRPTSRLAPRCRYGRSAAAPLHRASRLAAGTGAALLRSYIAPRASLPVRAQRCCAPTSPLAPHPLAPHPLAPHPLAPHSLAPLVPHPCIPSNTPPWNTINAASHAMANCPSRLTSIQRVPNSCRFAASAATHGV
jgi:hypothetical protein